MLLVPFEAAGYHTAARALGACGDWRMALAAVLTGTASAAAAVILVCRGAGIGGWAAFLAGAGFLRVYGLWACGMSFRRATAVYAASRPLALTAAAVLVLVAVAVAGRNLPDAALMLPWR